MKEHPEADEIEFVFTVTAKGTGGRAAADFAHRGFTGRSRHRVTRVDLPEPFGARDVLGFAEPDSGWLGPVVDGRTVSPYICLAERSTDRLMRGLNRVGLIAKLPRAALGSGSRHGSAVDASREPVAHRVAVLRRGRCLDAGLIRGNGDFRMAAASSVVFADAVVGRDGGERAKPGVWYPEEAMSLRRIGPALRGAGITVSDNSSGDCCRSE